MIKFIKRDYYTLANDLKGISINFNPNSNNNVIFTRINNYLEKIINYDTNKDLPKLHRWCNNTSPVYKDKCNWENKMTQANIDNSF